MHFPKNITIVFISDGIEPYDYKEIAVKIEQLKKQYLIQFISVAVGDLFPNSISNHLRENIHNQNQTCPPIFKAQRYFPNIKEEDLMNDNLENLMRPKQEILDEFLLIFGKIKELLMVSEGILETKEPAYQLLIDAEPKEKIFPAEPFFTEGNIKSKIAIVAQQQVKETYDPSVFYQLVKNTLQEALIIAASNVENNIEKQHLSFEEVNEKILIISNQIQGQLKESNQRQQFSALIRLVELMAEGKLKLETLDQSKITELQANLDNPEILHNILDQNENIEELQRQLLPQQSVNQMHKKLTQVRMGCYVRCKMSKRQLDSIQSIQQLILDGLIEYLEIMKYNPELDFNNVIRNFKGVIDNSITRIFQHKSIKLSGEHLIILRRVDKILLLMDTLLQDNVQISQPEAIELLEQCISLKDNNMLEADNQKFNYISKVLKLFIDEEGRLINHLPSLNLSQIQGDFSNFSIKFLITKSESAYDYIINSDSRKEALKKITNVMKSFQTLF